MLSTGGDCLVLCIKFFCCALCVIQHDGRLRQVFCNMFRTRPEFLIRMGCNACGRSFFQCMIVD